MYYSSFGMLALAITIIINHNVLWTSIEGNSASVKTKYKHFLLCVMAYFLTDILWGFFYDANLIGFVYADTVAYFVMMALSVLLWTRYVAAYLGKQNIFTQIMLSGGFVFLCYVSIALVVNFFAPVMFFFDAAGVYNAGWLRYVTLIFQVALFLVATVYGFIAAIKAEGKARRHHYAIAFSSTAMILFILLQTFYSLIPFYAIGCLIATCIVHTFITNDDMKDYDSKLGNAARKMYTDPLTGVKSNHAYLEAVAKVNEMISLGEMKHLAVAVFDLNGLKKVNDAKGHDVGNKYIQVASQIICKQFKHSPVFRIGGDEFVVFIRGEDYKNRISLIGTFNAQMEKNAEEKMIVVVSSGYSDYIQGKDRYYGVIFERADKKMYERKRYLNQIAKKESQGN